MAAASGRFSIRDYAAKMRIVDFSNSWPFVGEKYDKPPLPPILIRRFRWWAEELSAARSAAEAAETKAAEAPIDELFDKPNEIIEHQSPKSLPTTTIKKTTGDDQLRSPKTKTKMPKKRSIVELFASAPQIKLAAAAVDQSNGEDDYGEGKDEEEEEEEEEENVKMRTRKGKRGKGAIKVEICALTKEKVSKPKMRSSGHSHLLQDPINMKALRNTAEGMVESKKKFVKVNTLKRKHNMLQTTNLIPMNQKAVKRPPVPSILKNKNRFSWSRKTKKITKAKTVEFIKRCRKATRRVTFSEKDDILEHGKECSSIELPQIKSLCKIFSDVLTKSSVLNNSSKVHEFPAANDGLQMVNASEEDTNTGVVNRRDESSSQKNQSSDSLGDVSHQKLVNSSNSSCYNTGKASMAVMIDLNHAIETGDDLNCFNPSTENLLPSGTNSSDLDCKGTTHKKESSTSTEFHLQGLPTISLAGNTPTERNFVSTTNAIDLLTTMENPSPHSSTSCLKACNEKNEQQRQEYFHVDMKCGDHILENQSGHHFSPKDLLSNNIYYSMGSNKCMGSVRLSNSVSTSQSKSTGEDFISLPFHKQKFIQMHPGMNFAGSYEKQNLDLVSSHAIYANKKVEHDINVNHLMEEKVNDHLNCCQNQYRPTTERRFIEFIGLERLNNQNNESVKATHEFFHSHANKTKLSFPDGKIGDANPDFFKRVDQQEKSDLACLYDPAVQPTIRLMGQNLVLGGTNQNCNSSIMPEKYLSTRGSSTGSLLKLSDSPSTFYNTTGYMEPQFDSHIDDHGSEILSRQNIFSTTGNNISKEDVDSHALPHKGFLNKTNKLLGNSIAGEEFTTHQYYPTIASYQQNIQQNMLLSSTHCNHSQGVTFGTFVTPQSQVRYNAHENPFQSVQIQPQEKMPQWLFHAKHQKWNQLLSSPYSVPTDLSQPCRFSETNPIPHLFPYNMPTVPFSVDNISPAKTSTFAPNSSQSSFISVVTATNSISEVTKSNAIKNKEKEGSYSNFTDFGSQVDAQKFQNRHPGRDDVFMNSAKRPYFEKLANYSIPVEQQELSNAESSSFSRVDKESAVGGIKLVAGAKHVLKTNQKIDDGNLRPVK